MTSLKLWGEQEEIYRFLVDLPAGALFGEQRTGKTFITLALLRKLAGAPIDLTTGKGNDFCGVLLCLLNNRDSTWKDKLREYLPWLNATEDWEAFKKMPCPRLFLIHFEAFPRMIKKLVKYRKINWMAIDEAHRISNRGTKQSRAASRMSWVPRRLILTGTPIEKQPVDLFGQFRFLLPELFGKNWEEFEEEYMEFPKLDFRHAPKGSALWQKKILQQRILRSRATFKTEKLSQLIDLLKPYSRRVTKKEVGILEPEVHKVVVPLLGKQRRLYEQMEKSSVIDLGGGRRVLAGLEVTNIMKQRQIASGFVYDDEGELHDLGEAKLRRLKYLVKKLPKPLVVFTAFRPDNDRITRELQEMGLDVIAVHGQVKKRLRPDIWRAFQKTQYDVIVCQIKTGGVGVDLWKANYGIVHSMGHSFIDFDQAKSRMDSRDKKKPAQIFVLCGANTVDEAIYDLVIVKRLNGEEVLSKLKRRNSHG